MKRISFLNDYLFYFRTFKRRVGKRFFLLLLLVLITAGFEGLGITMLLPLLKVAEVSGDVGGKTAIFEEALRFLNIPFTFTAIILLIGGVFLLKGLFKFVQVAYQARLSAQITRMMKKDFLQSFYDSEYQYFASQNTGYFINLVNAQTNKFIQGFNKLANLTAFLITGIVYLAIAFVLDWRFSLMAIALGGIVLYFLRYVSRYTMKLSMEASDEGNRLHKFMVQTLQAMKFMKATGRFQRLKRGVYQSIERLARISELAGRARGLTAGLREPITIIAILGIVLVQVSYFEAPIAPIFVTLILFYRAMNTMLSFQGFWQNFMNSVGGIHLVLEGEEALRKHLEKQGSTEICPNGLEKGVEFEKVSFSYGVDRKEVLKEVDLFLEKNKTYALVGESGAGKSTISDLMTFLLKPSEGDIRVDGVSYKEIDLDSWRKRVGFVPQDTVVFDDTVANNIALWSCDPSDPDAMERIKAAARKAHCDDFVKEMEEGYDTVIGDRGVRLSGGQRQRLAIARELFREPDFLILDEATSSLDTASERYIQQSIDELKGKMTVVIIAHRLSTIQNVDKIYVLEEGRVVEEGSFEELTEGEGMASRFSEMVEMQRF